MPAASPEPAEPTLGRLTRFTELLVDVGLADAFDEARARATQASAEVEDGPKQPTSITDQAAGSESEAAPSENLTLRLDMGRYLRAIAKDGALMRLGSILFEVSEQEARAIHYDALEDAFFLYSSRCRQLTELLGSSAAALA